jgi:hypothetical protein
VPFFGTRRFDVHVKRTFMNTGSNERSNGRWCSGNRPGRHAVRRLRAQTHRSSHYNCFKTEEIAGTFTKLGVQNAGAFITRGVLIDGPGFGHVPRCWRQLRVTVDDLEGALKKQNRP